MTSPRTPRQLLGWTVPDHMHYVSTSKGYHHITCRHLVHVGGFPGRILSPHDEDLPTLVGHWFRDHAHGAPLSEVLPETPEPTRPECECFTTPEEQWTRHYDATEPGSMVEPNPDCQVHFPASQSVPAVPVSSTGGKETGEAAETVTEELRTLPGSVAEAIEFVLVRFIEGPQSRDVVRGILTEAFKASPLPDSETEWGWRFTWDKPDTVRNYRHEEADAREAVSKMDNSVLVQRRAPSPWIEVTS